MNEVITCAGNLANHIANWRGITTGPWILEAVSGLWIKTVLSDAGIDTSIFKAHIVRGPATSAAYNKGVPAENILKLANWSNETTFRRFYLRSAEPGVPDSAVNVVHLV